MATRFYLSNNNADKSFGGALSGGGIWETAPFIGAQPTHKIKTTKQNTSVTAYAGTVGNGTNPNDVLFYQGISGPLAAQTISGTVLGRVVVRENTSINTNAYTQLGIFVVNAAGTKVATLFGGSTSGGSEFNNPSANGRDLPRQGSVTITSYTCADGDRIVIEIGARLESTRTGDTVSMYFGDDGSDAGDANTNSPWVEFSANLTFGYTATGSFTADAIVKKTQTGSFTMDAVIYGNNFGFAIDAVKGRTTSASFTADAIKRLIPSSTFTVDALLIKTISGSAVADAIIKVTQDGTELDDSFNRTSSGTWGDDYTPWDSGMLSDMSVASAEGALYQDPEAVTSYSWRKFKINRPKRLNREILMQVAVKSASTINTSFLTASIYMRHDDALSTGLDFYTSSYFSLDARLNAPNGFGDFSMNQGTVDLGVRLGYSNNSGDYIGPGLVTTGLTWAPLTTDADAQFYIRFRVKGTSPTRVKARMWRVGDPEPTAWTLDFTTTSGPTTAGWVLKGTGSRVAMYPTWVWRRTSVVRTDFTSELDAVIKKTATGSFTANAIAKKAASGTFAGDAIVKKAGSGSLALDAVLAAVRSGSFSSDAVKAATPGSSFSLDAVIALDQVSGTGSFTADSILNKTGILGTFSADAVRMRAASAAFAVDAVQKRVDAGAFQVDAQLSRSGSGSFSTDSTLAAQPLVSFTADAILFKQQQSSATVDAIRRRGVTGSFNAEAVSLSPRTGAFTAQAVILATRGASFSSSAAILREQSGSFSLDSIRSVPRSGSFAVDAIRLAGVSTGLSADAVLFKTIAGSFSLDAVCGLAVLPDISAEFEILTLDAVTTITTIEFSSSMKMLEATLDF